MNDWRDDPITSKQKELLKELGLHIPATKGEASDLINAQSGKPTAKQTAMLKRWGLEIPSTMEEASDLIDAYIDKPTLKQIAKLEYMGCKVPRTKDKAAEILDEMEEDLNFESQSKLVDWDIEKYDLHPNLYPETAEEKENRLARKADLQKKNNPLLGCAALIFMLTVLIVSIGAFFGNDICTGLFIIIVILSPLGVIFHFSRKKKARSKLLSDPPPLPPQ